MSDSNNLRTGVELIERGCLFAGENECSNNPAEYSQSNVTRCPDEVGTEVVPILLGVYILITNVLMLNLLIAMFR